MWFNNGLKWTSQRKQKGFTLIEIILAILIFSIISVAIASVFSSGLFLSKRAKTQNQVYQEIFWVQSALTQEIENALDAQMTKDQKQEVSLFVGQEQKIILALETKEGLSQVAYYLVESLLDHPSDDAPEGTSCLVREEWLVGTEVLDEKTVKREILATHAQTNSLSFSYGIKKKESGWEWVSSWDKKEMPPFVRVKCVFVTNDGGEIPLSFLVYRPTSMAREEEK